LIFFSSFLSFFLAASLPAAACCESSSALAFFTLFNFSNCFLLVGIQLPPYASGLFYLPFFLFINIPVLLYHPVRASNTRKADLFNHYFTIFNRQQRVIKQKFCRVGEYMWQRWPRCFFKCYLPSNSNQGLPDCHSRDPWRIHDR